jgi:hypothetical protein
MCAASPGDAHTVGCLGVSKSSYFHRYSFLSVWHALSPEIIGRDSEQSVPTDGTDDEIRVGLKEMRAA